LLLVKILFAVTVLMEHPAADTAVAAHSSQRKIMTPKKNVIVEPLMKMHMITKSFATTRW